MSESIRVLHVDDEPDFTDLTADILKSNDSRFTVETAMNASAGMKKIESDSFDCIVSDYEMPEENGIEFLKRIRAKHPELPFILFTGKGSEEVASEAITAGVSDYLQKNVGMSQYTILANRISNLVDQYRARKAADETKERLRILADATNDVLWMFTADWEELVFVNSAYEEVWGRATSELRERPQAFMDGIHPDDRDSVKEAMETLSSGKSVDIEYRVNANEDFSRRVWVQGEPVFDDDDRVVRVCGFVREIEGERR